MYDSKRDKKFNKDEMQKLFRGKSLSIAENEVDYMFDEYDPKKLGYIEYYDMEKDFTDFVTWINQHRP